MSFKKAIEIDSEFSKPYYYLSKIYESEKKFSKALE